MTSSNRDMADGYDALLRKHGDKARRQTEFVRKVAALAPTATASDIARQFGLPALYISRICRKHGLHPLPPSLNARGLTIRETRLAQLKEVLASNPKATIHEVHKLSGLGVGYLYQLNRELGLGLARVLVPSDEQVAAIRAFAPKSSIERIAQKLRLPYSRVLTLCREYEIPHLSIQEFARESREAKLREIVAKNPKATRRDIAKRLRMAPSYISVLCHSLGIKPPRQTRKAALKRYARIQKMVASNPKMTRRDIAKRLGMSYVYVSALCLNLGIKVRRSSHKAT